MRRIRRDERGSSLIIALVFLMVFSLWLTATLSAAESGLHIADSKKVEPRKMYGADGSVEEAIQAIRGGGATSPPEGAIGAPSCDANATINGQTYHVSCVPQTGSGQAALTGSSPNWGIIALSTGVGNEAGIQKSKNGVIKIDGGVFSNSGLAVVNGSLCSGAANENCNQLNLCPNNTKRVTDAIFVGSGQNNNTPTKTVTSLTANFQASPANPGKNDTGAPIFGPGITGVATIATVAGPTSITMSAPAKAVGSNQTVTFRQDFPAKNSWCNPVNPSNAAGTPTPGVPISHGTLRVLPGSAVNCDPSNQSQTVAVSLQCPPSPTDVATIPNPTDPNYPPDATSFGAATAVPACGASPIVDVLPGKYTDVVGLNNLTAPQNKNAACANKLIWFHPGNYYFDFTGQPTPVWNFASPTSASAWVVAGNKTWTARPNGDQVFTGTVSASNATPPVITLTTGSGEFTANDRGKWVVAGTGSVPPMTIQSVTSPTKVVLNTPNTGALASGASWGGMFVVTDASLYSDAACDKTPTGEHPGAEFIFGGPSQMNVTNMKMEMCAPAVGGREQIAIYGAKSSTGSLTPQNGCVTAAPYPGSGCAFVSTSSDLMIHGTLYAPLAAVFMGVKNYDYQIVSRGVIARVVSMDMYPNAVFTDPVIYSPDYGTVLGADRRILMTACLGTSCNADGSNAKLRALVCIKDNTDDSVPCFSPPRDPGAVPQLGHKVTLESWTFVH
ncbi:MAG: hypothetical protein QOK28_3684 [Actinomycetota bacterium]|jgi:hypothetical protein